MNNLQAEGWDLSNLKYVELPPKEIARYLLQPGDILFNRTNSKELVGKCEVFRESGAWVFASYLIRVSVDSGKVLPDFISLFLNTPTGRAQIDRVSRQIVGMSNVNAEELQDLIIPLPSLSVQRKLVAEMEAAREARKQKLRKADELLASLGPYALATLKIELPRIDPRTCFAIHLGGPHIKGAPPGTYKQLRAFGALGRIRPRRLDPEYHHPRYRKLQFAMVGTERRSVSVLAEFSCEQWTDEDRSALKLNGSTTFRYLEINNIELRTGEIGSVVEMPIDDAPSRARMIVRAGDLIVSLTRPHRGAIALAQREHDGCVASTGFAVLRNINTDLVLPEYLWCILRSEVCLQQMRQRSSGGNYPAITEGDLAVVIVPVLDLELQRQVVTEINRRREQARQLETEAEANWTAAKRRFEAKLVGGFR